MRIRPFASVATNVPTSASNARRHGTGREQHDESDIQQREIGGSEARHAETAITCEALEQRQMLSVNWGAQGKVVGQDLLAQNYPSIDGRGETIAIVDSGVDYNHPVLGGGYGPGHKVIDGYNFNDNNNNPFPYDNAHGTGSAAMAAANPYWSGGAYYAGIASGANIVALRENGAYDGVKRSLDWVIANKYKYNIVSVNVVDWGGDADSFAPEVAQLDRMGVVITTPAGNSSGWYGSADPVPNQLIVGASSLSDTLTWFTNRGPGVDLLAPSENITVPYYDVSNGNHVINDSGAWGTSWSAPQAVGAAALVKQVNPNFSAEQVIQILKQSGKDVWDSGVDYKRLDVYAAVRLAIQITQGGGWNSSGGGNSNNGGNSNSNGGSGGGTSQPAPVVPTVSINDVSVTEGNSGTTDAVFTVSLSSAATQGVGVNFYTADGSATGTDGDFQPVSGTVWFNAGQTTRTITVKVNGDTKVEGNETFNVKLTGAVNCKIGDGSGTGTIVNNDTAPAPTKTTTTTQTQTKTQATTQAQKATPQVTTVYGQAVHKGEAAYKGHAFAAGETIGASLFNTGGEGIAYHDNDPQNKGGQVRKDGVDLYKLSDGRIVLGSAQANEWVDYTINVPAAGKYDLSVRLAAGRSGGSFQLEVDSVNVTGTIAVPNTGSWTKSQTIVTQGVVLPAGKHILRLRILSDGSAGTAANFESFRFDRSAVATPAAARKKTTTTAKSTASSLLK